MKKGEGMLDPDKLSHFFPQPVKHQKILRNSRKNLTILSTKCGPFAEIPYIRL